MFYRKNLYRWEQLLRVLVSLALVAWGIYAWGILWAYLAVVVGVVLLVTGLVGWCPMCAAFGKTLKT